MIDHTHNPDASSWVHGADAHPDFPVQNLPLGVFTANGSAPCIGTRIGDYVLDLHGLAQTELLPATMATALAQPKLNALFSRPGSERLALRHALFALLTDRTHEAAVSRFMHATDAVEMAMPFAIGDYTDFYVGIHHATNIGKVFRPDNPLLPNYKHVPIGYHGRASSVRLSGTPVIRPKGQIKAPDADTPGYAPCQRLDCELELGVWIAGDHDLGQTIPIERAWDRIGGLSLLNDWSARDVQAWEYVPLGPFLAKNFLTTISPWVITSQALAPFRLAQPLRAEGDPAPLPYLLDAQDQAGGALSIDLSITLSTPAMRAAGAAPQVLSRGNSADAMYWTLGQIVAHHASGGCDMHSGDLLGTGTLSGPTPGSEGSLMELSMGGKVPITLANGETRLFLNDGDELTLCAHALRPGFRSIGFGECTGMVRPAT